jgi:hypothetical protein
MYLMRVLSSQADHAPRIIPSWAQHGLLPISALSGLWEVGTISSAFTHTVSLTRIYRNLLNVTVILEGPTTYGNITLFFARTNLS